MNFTIQQEPSELRNFLSKCLTFDFPVVLQLNQGYASHEILALGNLSQTLDKWLNLSIALYCTNYENKGNLVINCFN